MHTGTYTFTLLLKTVPIGKSLHPQTEHCGCDQAGIYGQNWFDRRVGAKQSKMQQAKCPKTHQNRAVIQKSIKFASLCMVEI